MESLMPSNKRLGKWWREVNQYWGEGVGGRDVVQSGVILARGPKEGRARGGAESGQIVGRPRFFFFFLFARRAALVYNFHNI